MDRFSGLQLGDGGPAISPELNVISALSADANGDLLIAVDDNIREISSTAGIITTAAGEPETPPPGLGGYSSDGGPATKARLYLPTGIAFDSSLEICALLTMATTAPEEFPPRESLRQSPATALRALPAMVPSLNAQIQPESLAVGPNGIIYFSENNAVRALTPPPATTLSPQRRSSLPPLEAVCLSPSQPEPLARGRFVQFAGLPPGFVGLYQVNALVPAQSAGMGTVPLVVSIGGVQSNTVTMVVK